MPMDCFDIHTHTLPLHPEQAIVSVDVRSLPLPESLVYASVGIHPWYLTEHGAKSSLQPLKEVIHTPRIVAIGEVGLDRLRGASIEIQKDVFRQAVTLSEAHSLPLIIHCVRAFNELLKLKKELNPKQPWIIHGFRGKASIAHELLHHGCWLSIGERYQEEALRIIPLHRLFIETDESEKSIADIYRLISLTRGISLEELTEAVKKNVREVFFKG